MPPRARRSGALAAILSFIWPGLGQLYARRRVAAVLFATPALAAVAVVVYEARRGSLVLVSRLLDPGVITAIFVVVIAFGILRVLSVVHAFAATGPWARSRTADRLATAFLVVAIVATHAAGAVYLWTTYQLDQSFGTDVEKPNDPPTGSRVTILIAGLDEYSTRSESLYDSLMVVSVDTSTSRVAMISMPRDTAGYPLYFGGIGKVKINAIPTYVKNGWIVSGDEPITTLVKEIGYLVGVPINYYAVMDLASFMQMIDAVDGIDIVSPNAINDPTYDWLDHSPPGFALSAGSHHLDGRTALAYVRSRHGTGNSDYARAGRQQQLLGALVRKMATPAMLPRLPGLEKIAMSLVRTNFPASRIADMVALSQSIPAANYDKYVLGPPYSVSSSTSTAATSCLKLDTVAPLSVQLFGAVSRYYGKTQAPTC